MGIPKNPYACAICQKSFPITKSLLEHIKTNHEYLYSSLEPQNEPQKNDTQVVTIKTKNEHVASVHEGNKTSKCDICDYICSKKSNLNQHIAAVHGVKKPFKCDICDYTCSRKSNLKRHVATVHEVKKPYKCEICDYSCSQKSHMNRHVASVDCS